MDITYASNGKANAALTTGIIGTAGFGMQLLNNLLGNGSGITNGLAASIPAMIGQLETGDTRHVTRHELDDLEKLSAKDAEIMSLKSSQEMDSKMLELYKELASKDKAQTEALNQIAAAQAVTNQKLIDDMAYVKADYNNKIAAETQARKCNDNILVNYCNQTFYPKLIASITAGTTTTAEETYNPLNNCNCGQ